MRGLRNTNRHPMVDLSMHNLYGLSPDRPGCGLTANSARRSKSAPRRCLLGFGDILRAQKSCFGEN